MTDRVKALALAVTALVFVAGMAWTLTRPGPANPADAPLPTEVASQPTSELAATPTPSLVPTPTPTPAPTDTEAARLEALRATDAYVAFAEAARARTAPEADSAYGNFGAVWLGEDARPIAEQDFANHNDLWNELVPPMRDSLLLAGPPFSEPSFGTDAPIDGSAPRPYPPSAQPYIRLERQLQEIWIFSAVYTAPDATPRLRLWPVALSIDASTAAAEIIDVMEPFDLSSEEAATPQQGADAVRQRINSWIEQFPLPDPATDIEV